MFIPRYVDDITLCPEVVPPGWKLEGKELRFFEDKQEEDENVESDKRTMDIIKEIADGICNNIQVTYDIPSNYPDRKVPSQI